MKHLTKIEIYFSFLLLCGGLILLTISIQVSKKDHYDRIKKELLFENQAANKALNNWLTNKKKEFNDVVVRKTLLEQTKKLLVAHQNQTALVSNPSTTILRSYFDPILKAGGNLGVFIIAPDYTSIFSMRDENTGTKNLMAITRKKLLDKVLLKGETVFMPPMYSDIKLNEISTRFTGLTMFMVAPIKDNGKIIAAFSLRMDVYKDFTNLFQLTWQGDTQETLCFDADEKVLVERRFESESIDQANSNFKIATLTPITAAIEPLKNTAIPNTFFSETVDYKGSKSFFVQCFNKELQIGFRTKVDQSEKLEDYLLTRNILISLFIAGILGGCLLLYVTILNRKKITAALQISNNKLEEKVVERTKELKDSIATRDKFYSIIAHDLRSPFTGIQGLFEILLHNPETIPEPVKNKLMAEVYSSGNKLLKLLDNLLDWSKAQTHEIILKPKKISLHEIIDYQISLLNNVAENKNIKLKNEIPPDLHTIADRETLCTVFRNLISNAIKFTPAGGTVTIKSKIENETVKISVEDNGVGISKENIDTIFNLGTNTSTLGTHNEKGSGLGLILCKDFVELNNGKIYVESTVNVGTTFTIELPKIQKGNEPRTIKKQKEVA